MQITLNEGVMMVLPGGVTKPSDMLAALEEMDLPPLNCVGVGGAENDAAMLDLCGLPVAVRNAFSSLEERVALVTRGERGADVAAACARPRRRTR